MSFFFPTINNDIAPPPSNGHVSVHWNGYIIVWGGYHPNDADQRYHPSNDLWVFCIETYIWKQHKTTGNIPPPLSGSCASCVGCHMYLFAGHNDGRHHISDVYALDLRTFEWQNLTDQIEGVKPSGRDKLCCWFHNQFLVCFGGYGFAPDMTEGIINSGTFVYNTDDWVRDESGWNNHVFVLDTLKLTWSQPDVHDDPSKRPCPRAAHAAAKLGSKGYLFGGRFQETRRNDLYYLDLDTWEWSGSIQTTGTVPEGRSWHSLSAVSDRHLFLYGGFNNDEDVLGDTYILDTDCMMWSSLPFISPSTKWMWHTACTTSSKGEVVIFGGCETSILEPSLVEHCDSVLIFRFSAKSLFSLCADAVVKNLGQHLGELRKLPLHVLHSLIQPERLNSELIKLQTQMPGKQ